MGMCSTGNHCPSSQDYLRRSAFLYHLRLLVNASRMYGQSSIHRSHSILWFLYKKELTTAHSNGFAFDEKIAHLNWDE